MLPPRDDIKSEGMAELQKLSDLLISKGNAKQFYSKYFAVAIPHFRKLFSEFSSQGSTLVSTRIADKIVAYSKQKGTSEVSVKKILSVNEKCALQYLGGYVLSKLNRKIQFTKKQHSQVGQHYISFLPAGKATESASSHTLVDSVNRGGL